MAESAIRVKFANNIKLDGEAVDLESIAGKTSTGAVTSIYRQVCEKVASLPLGKAFPVAVPEGADSESLKRAVLGYAAKHFDQHFAVKVASAGNLVYVYIKSATKPAKKPRAPKNDTPPPPPA